MSFKIWAHKHSAEELGEIISSSFNQGHKVLCVKMLKGELDYFSEVARVVGEQAPMEEDVYGNKTGVLFTDIKYPWDKKSASYSHSNTRQPLHTDGSYESDAPAITHFYCKEAPRYGGKTTFIENDFLVEVLEYHDKGLLNDLRSTPIIFRKGDDSKTRPIIGENNTLTWNYHRCDKSNLTEKFHEFLEERIIHGGLVDGIRLEKNDALFFMDEQVLHGRNSFIGSRWLIKGGIHYERPTNS